MTWTCTVLGKRCYQSQCGTDYFGDNKVSLTSLTVGCEFVSL